MFAGLSNFSNLQRCISCWISSSQSSRQKNIWCVQETSLSWIRSNYGNSFRKYLGSLAQVKLPEGWRSWVASQGLPSKDTWVLSSSSIALTCAWTYPTSAHKLRNPGMPWFPVLWNGSPHYLILSCFYYLLRELRRAERLHLHNTERNTRSNLKSLCFWNLWRRAGCQGSFSWPWTGC